MNPRKFRWFRWPIAVFLALSCLLTSCSLPQVNAQERMFLGLSLEFVDEYTLPKQQFEDTPVGGLSGITYDRQRDRFYAISDDRGYYAPARFYTLKLILDSNSSEALRIKKIEVEDMTTLQDEAGNPYAIGAINPEGIAFAAPNSLFISSEGVSRKGIPPFLHEVNRETGAFLRNVPLPKRYLPDEKEKQTVGVQDNLGLESLTLNPRGYGDASVNPYRLFTATEAPLLQDVDDPEAELAPKNRLLHYLIGDGPPVLISENLYPLDNSARWSIYNGLTELLALRQGGHLLSLERSFGLTGFGAKIFEITTGSATDTSRIASLKGQLTKVEPVGKNLLFDLSELGMAVDNLEGMTLGPVLPDGSESLIVVGDNNFNPDRGTQFLLFRLRSR